MKVTNMADISSGTPEATALDLLEKISGVEKKVFHSQTSSASTAADRKWILDTYAECLSATKGNRLRP
jgi:hypothetical protein